LEDLIENRGAIFDRLGEDLEQIAFIITVNENAEAF